MVRTDTFVIADFLDAVACARLSAELRDGAAAAAALTGSSPLPAVNRTIRSALRVEPSPATAGDVAAKLAACRPALERHFGVELGEFERPQFLRYVSGDHFVAHQDGNTPLIRDSTLARRVSVTVFLNAPSDDPAEGFGGGDLVFHGPFGDLARRDRVTPSPGTLIAFRSETTHEVEPITHGERYAIVSWYRAPEPTSITAP